MIKLVGSAWLLKTFVMSYLRTDSVSCYAVTFSTLTIVITDEFCVDEVVVALICSLW